MRGIYKRIISLLLIVAILVGTFSVLAFEDRDVNITLSEESPTEYEIELPDKLPEIKIDESEIKAKASNISMHNVLTIEQGQAYTGIPKMQMPDDNSLEIPDNRKISDENRVSANEIGDEDVAKIEELKARKLESFNKRRKTINKLNSINSSTRTTNVLPIDSSYRLTNINSKDSYALQNQIGRTNYIGDNIGEEYIDPLTGNLVVTETDLVLPGVDGLDLNLSRYYSLAQAELYTKAAGISTESVTYTLPVGTYVVEENIYNNETREESTYYYAYSDEEEAELKIEEITTRDTCNGLYAYNAWWDISSEGDTITFDYYYTSDITASSYQTVKSNLGAGWSWSFPSVQTIKDNYNDYDEFELPNALYYHDGKGNVMEVEIDSNHNCSFTNYVGKDITFEIIGTYLNNICSTARIDYMVEDSDCTEYYFGPHGEIRSIIDIHGNKIEFSYTRTDFYGAENWPIIASITDTVGRTVDFNYTTDDDYEYIEIEITSPIESEEKIELLYRKKMIDVSCMDEYLSTEPFLEAVTYPNGEITHYFPAIMGGERSYVQPLEFTFADKSFDSEYVYNTSGYSNTLIYLLGNIVRPNSNTYYYYDLCERNLGHSGICQTYRIDERGDDLLVTYNDDIIDGYSSNIVEYKYSLDYTGYPYYNSPQSIPNDEYVCRVTEERENSTFKRYFYKIEDAVLEQEERITYNNPVGNSLYVSNIIENYNMKMPVEMKSTYSNDSDYGYDTYRYYDIETGYCKSFGRPLLQTEEMDYDTFVSAEREKHGISYTYDSDTGFVLSRSWYKSNLSKCTERFTYDSNGRLTSYTAPNGTVTNYTYEYANGKVSKKTTTTENDTGTTIIVENYDASTAYAFPTTVVKTVTTSGRTTTETTSYTYDMLYGLVESMMDNDGNTTYYEYDAVGRPTKIIHPVYSTYSEYNTKNIIILPVENIAYNNVIRSYDSVVDSDEDFHAQEIIRTTSYYDVSDIEISDPRLINVNNLEVPFYGAEINYYIGTGELIEKNVLDTVDDVDVIYTTAYFYNTYANTVKEVDAKGNSTIIQYDGAGREVKVTDQFDNYHITEYNMSSDEPGFKSQSYFVPVTDRSEKQNIVEYTYDILGRTTEEKAYSDYPSTSVEVKYEYDFVGNVIGIIDANNNLNEDGYTQTNTFDKLNRVTSSKNANNEIIRNTYDNLGNIKKQTITDSSGAESILYQRRYDGDGKIILDTDNAGNSNLYVYDNMGRLYVSQDKSLKINGFAYNELGTLDKTTNEIDNYSITLRNYAFKNPYGPNKVIDLRGTYDDSVGTYRAYISETTQYSYYPTGKLKEQYGTYAIDTGMEGVAFNPYVEYKYDSTGNVVSALHGIVDNVNERTWGATTYYEYNKNRLSQVQIDGANARNTASNVNVSYEYYDDGKLKSVTYPALTDGSILKSEYVYDGLSRLTALTNYKGTDILSSYTYTYDSNGNILTTTETVGAVQNSVEYTYDKLNRIASVSGTKGADSYYEYDARGNRKANFEQIDYLSEESAIFIYDAEDNLDRSQVGDNITHFEYSANGYRYFKRENSDMPEYYVYDPDGRLQAVAALVQLSMTDGSSLYTMYPVTQYIWGPDRVLAKIDKLTNKSYYYLYNGHGDVVQIVDTSGAVKNTYDYDVWGNFLKKEETTENHFTYFGQTYDETTGLYYLRARYYDPTIGRFTQQDPAEDGYNWYIYGNQNPTVYADETGENAALAIPWVRQQLIWKNGVRALNIAGLPVTAQMLDHSIRWFYATDVNISGSSISGSDRIGRTAVVNALKGSFKINNEIDWQVNCANSGGVNNFYWKGVLTLNDTTDLYLSFNNATVTLSGTKNKNGSWSVNVNVYDIYDFDIESFSDITSFKSAIGSAAGTAAALEQIPILGAIKNYSINVNFDVSR